MGSKVLTVEITESVAVITLNHPPINALGPAFLEDFSETLQLLEGGHETRAVLLTSACPGFFSVGDDLKGLAKLDPESCQPLFVQQELAHQLLERFERLPIPTVAAIDGVALGGGLELALACDFRLISDKAGRLGLPEVRLGMIPALGGTQRLTQLVGKARALEMMLKGRQLTPEEALSIGLVNKLIPRQQFAAQAFEFARKLARQATLAIGHIKRCVAIGLQQGADAGFAAERESFRANIQSQDASEGVAAFLAGRKPNYRGR